MQSHARRFINAGQKIGLVPTMGFLHEGHLSLIKKAKKLNDVVITTIFVNPTQFGPNEDFAKYPRDEKKDIERIKKAGGDIIFIPRADAIYPPEFQTYVDVEEITNRLEGASRPGHFRGVSTIVTKLFNITRPDMAVFGMKDYQQAMVIKRMVTDLNFPIRIIIAPTVREKDGLAMSSRNIYFDADQRKEAVCLYRALVRARDMVKKQRITSVGEIKQGMQEEINKICPSSEIDYISFTDMESLEPVEVIVQDTICSLAVKVHGVRLIDNMKLA